MFIDNISKIKENSIPLGDELANCFKGIGKISKQYNEFYKSYQENYISILNSIYKQNSSNLKYDEYEFNLIRNTNKLVNYLQKMRFDNKNNIVNKKPSCNYMAKSVNITKHEIINLTLNPLQITKKYISIHDNKALRKSKFSIQRAISKHINSDSNT